MNNNNDLLLIAGAVFIYMMMQRGQVVTQAYGPPKGAVPSMPGNVGTGWEQMAQGAVAGFLQALAKGPSNNTSQSRFSSYADPLDAIRGDIVQEAVPDVPGMTWDGEESAGWFA